MTTLERHGEMTPMPISIHGERTSELVTEDSPLRSKKLLDLPAHVEIPWEVNVGDFYKHMNAGLYNEDGNICVHNRHIFEANGCKFAPVNVASKFAREATLPDSEKETFGFHYHFQEIR